MRFRHRKKRRVTIDISAMIDVVFLLLLFFLVTSTFLEAPGINLDLPDATSSTAAETEELTVVITEENQIFFGGKAIRKQDFPQQLIEAMKSNPRRVLIVQADEKTDHGIVVHIIDQARLAGMKNLVIATEPAEEGAR